MKRDFHRVLFSIPCFMVVVALACNAAAPAEVVLEPTATTEPTSAPLPTRTPRPEPSDTPLPEPSATSEPTEEPTAAPEGAITLSDEPFEHPSGAFSISFPAGWDVNENSERGASAAAPDGSAAIGVFYENVGEAFESLDAYIEAFEQNRYAKVYPGYERDSTVPQSDGSVGVFKTLEANNTTYHVATYYWQEDETVFIEDMWVKEELRESLTDGLLDVINSMNWDASAVESDALYTQWFNYPCPEDVCAFHVPYSWQAEKVSDTHLQILNFWSPPKDFRIEILVLRNPEDIPAAEVRGLALLALKNNLGLDPLVGDGVQKPDGRVELNFLTEGQVGVMYYEARGPLFISWTFYALTYEVWLKYYQVWADTAASYTAQ